MEITGVVTELHRWPVKSMAGEPVDALRIDDRGAGGDRTHAVIDAARDRRLTAREAPRLLAWRARYPQADGATLDPATPPRPVVTSPDGRELAWEDPELVAALQADLGRSVTLKRDVRGIQDLPETLLVTSQATLDALTSELGEPVDLRRFRTNVHIVLDAGEPWMEHRWEGRRLRVGDAELDLLHPCVRCVIPTRSPDTQEKWPDLLKHLAREHGTLFGINARPTNAATLRVGDRVELV